MKNIHKSIVERIDRKKTLVGLLLAACLVMTFAVPVQAFSSQDIRSLYSGQNAFEHVQKLAGFGPRTAGGEVEKKAASYIASEMSEYGLNVTIQEFPIIYFEDMGSTLEVMDGAALAPNTLTYSPTGEFTAQIVDVGLGRPEDFPAEGIHGKIALIKRGQLYFWQKTQNAAASGAVAVIIYNNAPGNFFGTLTFITDIPAVSISKEEGEYLQGLMGTGDVKVHLKVDTFADSRTTQNVIGTLPGIDPDQGIVYIGGHYDSVSSGPGANDDASGTAAMLEAARVFSNKGHRTKATMNFIAFGSEEVGLVGSYNYVLENLDEVSTKGIGMINLDMIGVGDTLLIGNIGYSSSNLTNYTRQKASAMGINWTAFDAASNSDHTYFENAGVPAVFLYQSPDPWYHTSMDTPDKIDRVKLENNGELGAAAMYDWAKNPVHRVKKDAKLKKIHVYQDRVLDVE